MNAIDVVGLSKRYGSRLAVDDLSLGVKSGETYGFLGPNGAGKTTAIRCMLGLISHDAGNIQICGSRGLAARRHVGALVETPAFHGALSGKAVLQRALAYAGQGDASDVDRVLELVGLRGREREPVKTYSLGMKQRLGIARALVGQPKVLVLDEPTNGLDPRGMKEVRDLLGRLARDEQMTIFISSHLLTEIEALCNRVAIVDRGRLVAEGEVKDLVAGRGTVTEVDVTLVDPTVLEVALGQLDGAEHVGEGGPGAQRVCLNGLSVPAFTAGLVQAGAQVEALVPVKKSLEDLFLSMTQEGLS